MPRRPRSPRPHIQTLEDALEQEHVLYDCTRCRDPYIVEEKLIFPLYVIWDDLWLRFVFVILVIGMVVMMSTFVALASHAAWGSDLVLIELFGFRITVIFLALVLASIGMGAGMGLATTIWRTSSGRKRLVVRGTPL
jgi:hypothetical protein